MTSVDPTALNKLTLPPLPSCTTTRFGIVSPVTKFKFDANGRRSAERRVGKKRCAGGFVNVTFRTTAVAPAGTPPRPVTCKSNDAPPPNGATGAPFPDRVSNTRAGTNGKYDAPPPVVA